jgi:hypothetical protein
MVDTLEEVAAVLRAFIRSAGQGTAQPLFDPTKTNTIGPGQLNVGPGSGPRAPMRRLLETYEACLKTLTDEERSALDQVIRTL